MSETKPEPPPRPKTEPAPPPAKKPAAKPKKTAAFASVEEALENAGSTVLAHLGSNAKKLTVEEVKQYEEENHLTGEPLEGEYRAYSGPYEDEDDPRNSWTAVQDMEAVPAP